MLRQCLNKIKTCSQSFLDHFSKIGPLSVVALFMLSLLGILTVFRGLLFISHFDRIKDTPNLRMLFPMGLRMDIMIICYLSMLPILLSLVLPMTLILKLRNILLSYFSVILSSVLFMEIATFPFIEEYDLRPDILFVEYLNRPREVFGTLFADYKFNLLLGFLAVVVISILTWKIFSALLTRFQSWSWIKRLLVFPLVAGLVFLGARSSIGHRPANISTASFSNNHLANELALNSTYTLLYAIYRRTKHEKNPSKIYGKMKRSEIFERVQRAASIPEEDYIESDVPFSHKQVSPFKSDRPLNVVIFLQESLGARFVGSLGGLPLTPNLDDLANEGMLLTELYATGTRTVRGIESTVCGFFPTPGPSIVKLGLSKKDFFTMGSLLKSHGYATEFIYGGMSNFDEMRSFFGGNGFDEIYDEPTFDNPGFRGVWGVSDEDLVQKAHQIFLDHGDKPFFAVMLSTSNHSPFEFPEGRIELYEEPQDTRLNAMKYADYAIGEFFKLAKTAPYYQNTIFLIVADHDTRVRGNDLVPIDRFHIPALIIGPDVPHQRYDKISSQLDLLPTLLHFTGLSTIHPMLGRNLMMLDPETPGRAFMQYGEHNAYRVGDDVLIMLPEAEPRQFKYRNDKLVPVTLDQEFSKDALAHSLMPWYLYRQREYRLP